MKRDEKEARNKKMVEAFLDGATTREISMIFAISQSSAIDIIKRVTGTTLKPLAKRFWEKVDKRGPDECWNWVGSKRGSGYGHMQDRGNYLYAHRVSWVIHNGSIPEGMIVCHSCDNPLCVNPRHLWVGTYQDNARDRDLKGRNGAAHRLSVDDVRDIRERHRVGTSLAELARLYQVGETYVGEIVRGRKRKV